MASKKSLSHKITFLLFLTYLTLFNFLIPKAYADCYVEGNSHSNFTPNSTGIPFAGNIEGHRLDFGIGDGFI